MAPAITVLLPVCNGEITIERAIDSILQQSFQDFELVIIENGSTDKTIDQVLKIEDHRIVFESLPDKCLVSALNHGLSIAKGKYIARMDSDDFSYADRLQVQFNFLEANQDMHLVSGLIDYIGDEINNQGYYQHVLWLNQIINHEEIYNNRFVDAPLSHPSIMFRKSIADQFGGYKKGSFPEDFELWNRWLLNGVRMAKIKQPVIQWCDRKNRLSRIDKRYADENFADIKANYFAQWFSKNFPDEKPNILVWGNGSAVKRKAKYLEKYGLKISAYIDVIKSTSSNSVFYEDLIVQENIFILNYVSDRKGRSKIYEFLIQNHFAESGDFYMMS